MTPLGWRTASLLEDAFFSAPTLVAPPPRNAVELASDQAVSAFASQGNALPGVFVVRTYRNEAHCFL